MPVDVKTGTYLPGGEKLHWTYYDTATLVATGVSYSLFQTQLGAGATPKTYAQTNLTSAGQIPKGQKFTIHAISLEFLSHAQKVTADIQLLFTFLTTSWIRFIIPGKDSLYTKTISTILGTPVLWSTTPTVAGNNELIMSIGRFVGVDRLSIPIIMEEQTPFEVRLEYPTALGATNIVGDFVRVNLNGILDRKS